METASSVWSGGLTKAQEADLSRVQRRAVAAAPPGARNTRPCAPASAWSLTWLPGGAASPPPSPGAPPPGQTPATRTSSPGGRATPRRGAGGSGRNPSAGPPDTSTHPSPTSPGQAAQPIIFVLFNICFCALSVCDLDNWRHFIAIVSWRYSLPVDCD